MERLYLIKRIINRFTGLEVCPQYLNIPVSDFIAIMGEPLKVRYKNGAFFTHEIVIDSEYVNDNLIIITTTRKEWYIERGLE